MGGASIKQDLFGNILHKTQFQGETGEQVGPAPTSPPPTQFLYSQTENARVVLGWLVNKRKNSSWKLRPWLRGSYNLFIKGGGGGVWNVREGSSYTLKKISIGGHRNF